MMAENDKALKASAGKQLATRKIPERKKKNRANVVVSDALWDQVEAYQEENQIAVGRVVELALTRFFDEAPKADSVAHMTPRQLEFIISSAMQDQINKETLAERVRYEAAYKELGEISREIDKRWAKLLNLGQEVYRLLKFGPFSETSGYNGELLAKYKSLIAALEDPKMQTFPISRAR